MFRLLVAFVLFSTVSSQAMTQPAVKRFFKYCAAADLTTATKNLNAGKDVAACNKACSTFASGKKFLTATANPPTTDALGKPAGATTACQTFCAHRFSVKKYITYQFANLNSQFFTAAKAKELQTTYWSEDKKNNNNFNKTVNSFMPKALSAVGSADRQNELMNEINTVGGNFAQKFPNDFNNVWGYVYDI